MNFEFKLFYDYSKMIQDWLKKTLRLASYSNLGGIDLVYSTPARAFSKYAIKTENGQLARPLIAFSLNGIEYLRNENLLGYQTQRDYNSSQKKYILRKPLLIYRLLYSINIYTKNRSDADILIYQLLSNSSHNQRAVEIVNKTWAEFYTENPRNETNLEPGEVQDVIHRNGMDLIVMRAYLPQPVEPKSINNIIESISTDMEGEVITITGDSA